MRIHLFVAVALVAALLAGCGGGSGTEASEAEPAETLESADASDGGSAADNAPPRKETQVVWVALDGWETAETLGLVMAESRGYFTKSRLAVTTLAPITPALSIPDVLNGSDEIGVAHSPQVVLAKEKGAPIIIIGGLVPHPTAAMIWPRESNIGGIADLKGKTIAIPGLSFQRAFLEQVLARAGLTLDDVKVKKVGNDLVPTLVKGRADAIFGGSGNLEGADLESHGIEPVVTPIRDLGIPDYDELVLVARSDRTTADPLLMHDFAAAAARGADTAAAEPKSALKALESAGERNPEISPKARAAEVKRTIPLLSTDGQIDPDRLEGLVEWMYEEEMIESELPVEELLASP